MSFQEEIRLTARDDGSSVIQSFTGNLRSLIGAISGVAGVVGVGVGLGALVKQGIEFNKTMEDSRSGIASLILANNVLTDSMGKVLGPTQSLTQAFKIAEGVQADLRAAAMTSSASYKELVASFQTAYGPATAAGITSLSKIKDITVSASQAVAALGLDSRQTAQEVRALFKGDVGPNNALTTTLGITKAEMDRVRASGEDLGDFLIQKLKPFADVASKSMGNFSTVISNLGDAMDQVTGEAFAPLFREIKSLASGLGGTAGNLSGGLGVIGQGLADGLRAIGPFLQALAGLGVAAAKAGTSFLAAFAPAVPALTGLANVVTGLTDGLGIHAIALWASVKAFHAFGPAAVAAAQGLSLFFAKMQLVSGAENAAGLARLGAAFATLGASVTAAQVAMAAVPAAIAAVLLAGLKLKGMWEESKADEAWARAATTQQTFIDVLERKYQKTIDIAASEELLNMAHAQRALVMDRVIKLDKDGVITLDDVKSAMAAMTEETMKARNAASGFAEMQEKTKEKYQELLTALKAEIRIGGLEGLKKDLAVVAEEFRKKRDQIRKEFFDAGSGQWAQDPKALLGLLGIRETQQIQEKAREFAKAFKAIPEEIVATWETELKKLPGIGKRYFSAAGEKLIEEQDAVLVAAAAGWWAYAAEIPKALQSAETAVYSVFRAMGRAFDDLFYNVFTGRLDSLGDVFKGFADQVSNTFAALVSDMVQRVLSGQESIAEGLKNVKMGESTGWGSMGAGYANGGGVSGAVAGAALGYGAGSLIGQVGGGQYNQTGGQIGGVIGGALAGAIGALVGAIIGTLIGALLSSSTLKHAKGSLGAMVGATSWEKFPIYDPANRPTGPRGRDDEDFDPGEPIGWEWRGSLQAPKSAFERQGQKIMETQAGMMADLFRLGGKDQARELLATYQKAVKDSLSGANFDINAGSKEDIEERGEWLLTTLLPRIGLSAAFGQKGYLPPGYQDRGGVGNLSYGMPGMDPATGEWLEKQLFDPEAPIPKMLAGLGFTEERIAELAGRISTDDPKKLLEYITGIVGVVVGLRALGEEMGKSFEELKQGWADEASAGPAAALGKQASALAALFDELDLYSGDEQLKKAQEAQDASSEFWEGVKSYLTELKTLSEKLSAGLQGMREEMRAFLNPLSEDAGITADWSNVEGVWGRLFGAMDASEIERATNDAAAAIERIFNVMAERVTRGNALLERTWDLFGKLGSLRGDVAFDQLVRDNPLRAWEQQLVDMQTRITKAATLSGLEQISALEEVGATAEEMYANLQGFLSDIANVSASINKSIDSQIWELGVGELDAAGQASAVGQRIRELQDQLRLATSPAEVAAITSEIQSLMSRYVGQFRPDDENRAEAIAWAQEQLERARGLANETLAALREAAEEQAEELQGILKGAADLLAENVTEASGIIGQLSHTLGELDRIVRESLERLGQDALDSLAPLREAMEGAAEIFTHATGDAALALSGPEVGLGPAADRASGALGTFEDAVRRAAGALREGFAFGPGDGSAKSTQAVTASRQPSSARILATVKRYSGSLKARVA